MRIAILAHALHAGGGYSVGRNLVAAFGRVAPQHHYLVIVPRGLGYEEICRNLPHHDMITVNTPCGLILRWMYDTWQLPRIIKSFKPDVIVGLGNRGLPHPPCAQAVLCHEPHFFYSCDYYGPLTLKVRLIIQYQIAHFRKTLRRTQLLLCQTTVARDRLRRSFRYSGRIELCPNAISEFIESAEEPETPLPKPMKNMRLLLLAHYYPHKNIERVVEAFEAYGNELSGVQVVLTIAPEQHPNAGKLLRRIEESGLSGAIINIGPVHQSSLATLYHSCNALLLPTLLESFSGTYLEAMHFGVPIITSDLDFAHGICGDAALYFDPWSPCAIKDAIVRFMAMPEIVPVLVNKGRERLNLFSKSWDEISSNVIRSLEEIRRSNDDNIVGRKSD
jgi:glycosyltransferase involved in cell wall biosynthesis